MQSTQTRNQIRSPGESASLPNPTRRIPPTLLLIRRFLLIRQSRPIHRFLRNHRSRPTLRFHSYHPIRRSRPNLRPPIRHRCYWTRNRLEREWQGKRQSRKGSLHWREDASLPHRSTTTTNRICPFPQKRFKKCCPTHYAAAPHFFSIPRCHPPSSPVRSPPPLESGRTALRSTRLPPSTAALPARSSTTDADDRAASWHAPAPSQTAVRAAPDTPRSQSRSPNSTGS